jgi:hypothetical protein
VFPLLRYSIHPRYSLIDLAVLAVLLCLAISAGVLL